MRYSISTERKNGRPFELGWGRGGGGLKVENGRIRSAENLFSQTCGTEGQSVCCVKDPVQSRCST